MWDGFNKRKFPRLSLQCEILVQPESQSEPLSAVTENLGVGGVCVILNHSLDRFSPCKVRLQIAEGGPRLECSARVVWSVPTREVKSRKTSFDTGLEFVGIETAAADKIRSYIESEIKRDPSLIL